MEPTRPLDTPLLAEHFVNGILQIEDKIEAKKASKKITAAELELVGIKGKCTHESTEFLDSDYRTSAARAKLHAQIVFELKTMKRLADDEHIRLGKGGALPKGKVRSKKQAVIVTGLPASGKSFISNTIADEYGAIIIDCDYAKRKLPEFSDVSYGAHLVHNESSQITYEQLLPECVKQEYNIVIPKIGYSPESLEIARSLKVDAGYDVHLVLISLDRQKATKRAYNRFIQTGRYVPLSLIFDKYCNDPILTYYRIKNEYWLKTWGKISTDVSPGQKPILVEAKKGSPALLFKSGNIEEKVL